MSRLNLREPFALGQTLITAKATGVLHPHEVLASLYRHARGESNTSTHPATSGTTFQIATEGEGNHITVVSLSGETDLSDVGLIEAWVSSYGCRSCG